MEVSTDLKLELNTIDEAIADIKAGKVVIVVDDEDRENEGDFICAAECITPDIINFMATHGRGLICTPITSKRAAEMELTPMVKKNTDMHGTAFTVSIDYLKENCTTGISAYDRATGIKALCNSETKPNDFARPGHIFPLIASEGGVLRRSGHTEAAIDLARLAGYKEAGVLVEILNKDGSMARLPQLVTLSKALDLKLITIKDLVAYRMQKESLIERKESVQVETPFGEFNLIVFSEKDNDLNHLAIVKGEWTEEEAILTRVHSSTNMGDVVGAIMKNHGKELSNTLEKIAEEGKGVILFLRQHDAKDELIKTIQKLKEQKEGGQDLDPFPHQSESTIQRNIGIGAQILSELGLRKLRILTNNPKRRIALKGYNLEIVENVAL